MAYNARAVIANLATRSDITPYKLALVTLTQRNVQAYPSALRTEIDALQEALRKLRHIRQAQRDILGSVRTVEVTYNTAKDTWHPHVHLIAVIKNGSPCLTANWWQQTWKQLRDLDYAPQIDCQIITRDDAVYEVSKYVSKLTSLVSAQIPEELKRARMTELNEALSNRNLVIYTGIWRKIRAEIRLNDEDDTSLPAHNPTCLGAIEDAIMRWTGSEYRQA